MRDSVILPRYGVSAALPGGAAVRWPLAIAAALAVECAIVALGWPASRPAEPVVEPIKVMKLVTIAEAPPLPEPAPPVPPTSRPPPKPAPRPLPKPAPVPQAKTEPVQQASASVADVPTQAQTQAQASAPAETKPAAPAPQKPAPGAVRRGLVPLVRVEPEYPPKALASNTEGVVVAHVTIEKDGTVSAVKIVRAQPARLFDQAATKALMQWKFSRTDEPVLGEVELRFNLN